MKMPHCRALTLSTSLQARKLFAKDLRNDFWNWSRGSGRKDLVARDTNEANARCLLSNHGSELRGVFVRDPPSEIDDRGDPSFAGGKLGVAAQPGLGRGFELSGADEGELCLGRGGIEACVHNCLVGPPALVMLQGY